MGSTDDDQKALDNEKPQRKIELSAFRIARYPVTNAQYRAFLDGGGYTEKWKRAWLDEGWSWKRQRNRTGPVDYEAVFLTPNHPRVGVTWYEAEAFCSLALGEARHESGATERGAVGEGVPGGGREESILGETGTMRRRRTDSMPASARRAAVGLFPAGASPYDVLDMSGNVLEWCADDLRGSRALGGGSFVSVEGGLRCAGRVDSRPGGENGGIGFRVSSPV